MNSIPPLTSRLTFALALCALSMFIILANLVIAVRAKITGRPESFIPLLGGILGATGCVILPVSGAWLLAPLPLILDLGSIPSLIPALIHVLRSRK